MKHIKIIDEMKKKTDDWRQNPKLNSPIININVSKSEKKDREVVNNNKSGKDRVSNWKD